MPAIKCNNGKWKWGNSGECIYNSKEDAEKQGYMENRDMTNLNQRGYDHAVDLIKAEKVNRDSDWSFDAADGNALLGDDNWTNYSKWFLAYDDNKEEETKAYYGYPFGKDGEVYRKALTAIRQRAGQMKMDAIFEAAGRLLEMVDAEENSKRHIISVSEDDKTVTIVYEKDTHEEEDYEEENPTEEIIEEIEEEELKNRINIWDKKYNNSMEKRIFNIKSKVEKRQDGSDVVIGYASVYDSRSENLGGFYEYIDKGAFTDELIKKSDVRALINHDPNLILARNTSGTLKLDADPKGLRYEFKIPDTTYGKDLAVNMRNGNLSQSSFAFIVKDDEWSTDDDGNDIRTIKEIDSLHDISVVTYPAYRQAESDLVIAQRGLASYKEKQKNQDEEKDLVARSLAKLKIELIKRK